MGLFGGIEGLPREVGTCEACETPRRVLCWRVPGVGKCCQECAAVAVNAELVKETASGLLEKGVGGE